jgi:cellobiose phosphorylase
MGTGDWNDGMNRVGREGKGESVWLAWFLCENLRLFGDLARGRGDEELAALCTGQAEELRANIEAHAWDGGWYRRAYFDDGTPLGSSANNECRIDSISQSWAVISGAGDPLRARQAMAAVGRLLVERDPGLVKLLDPAFDTSALEPGYIKGYVPGVRENGGQYTHAAVWAAMAYALMGDGENAWELFSMLNPIHHGSDAPGIALYKAEPYVMCADIYAAPPHRGRGGWSWYTGAAGWMYQFVTETLLGIHLEVDKLRLVPLMPKEWMSYKIHYRYRETFYHITIARPDGGGGASGSEATQAERVTRVLLDGADLDQTGPLQGVIPLVDDRHDHHVEVEVG